MERAVISEIELLFVRGERRVPGAIRVCQPWVVSEAEARCEIEIRAPGVIDFRHAIAGGDGFQALLLAIRFLGTMLTHYRDKGLRLLEVGGQEWPLEAYFGELGLDAARPRATVRIRVNDRRRRRKS